jgi:hypothetical protein
MRLKKQACPNTKKLRDDETASMIRHTAVIPVERQKRIHENLNMINKVFENDPFAKAFDISVQGAMMPINGRVLEPPVLGYRIGNN